MLWPHKQLKEEASAYDRQDLDLLINSSYPRFTDCFQYTLLVWVPCGFVWLVMPFYLYFVFCSKDPPLPVTRLNLSKSICSVLLCVLSGADVVVAVTIDTGRYPNAFVIACGIKAVTFLLTVVITQLERRKGRLTSGLLFFFWFLSTIAGIVPFYTFIIEKTYNDELFRVATFYISFALILMQLVLNSFAEKYHIAGYQPIGNTHCPEIAASFPSHLTFWWMTPLIIKIFWYGIKEDDFWNLRPQDQSGSVLPDFHKALDEELRKYRKPGTTRGKQGILDSEVSLDNHVQCETAGIINGSASRTNYNTINDEVWEHKKDEHVNEGPSLMKVLVKSFGRDLFIGMLMVTVSDLLQFVSPMILSRLIAYVETKNSPNDQVQAWVGYIYAAGMFVVAATRSVLFHRNAYLSNIAGMRMRSALISAVYNKALTMSNEVKKNKTQGEIVNLMSVDCQRIQDVTAFLWLVPSSIIQFSLCIVFLWNTLGVAVLSGLVLMLLLIPVNGLIATKQKTYQVQQMNFKDERLKLMGEVLNGIKVLKFYAWEPSFEKKVTDVRQKELRVILRAAYLGGLSLFIFTCAPFLVNLATFATYILVDRNNHLDAQKAFVSLALFNILRFPLNYLPTTISNVVQGSVSLERINEYLQTEDLDPRNIEHTEHGEFALSIERGTLSWDRETDPILKNINLDVTDGKLVAVVGHVGAGKSSLLSAFLGEMAKLEGRVEVKGSVAYVSQQAWIQNDSLRDNILFGEDMDKVRYGNVIDACALQPDLDILQAGDMTEIGEKGINLSGGQKQRISLARAVYNDADIYLLDDPLSAVDSHVGKHIFNNVIGAKGILRKKTRVLVTHGVNWLPFVDQIVVMVNGRISELGSYQELLSHDGAFAKFLKTYLTQADDDEDDQEDQELKKTLLKRLVSVADGSEKYSTDTRLRKRKRHSSMKKEDTCTVEEKMDENNKNKATDKLIEEEKVETGKVSWKVYLRYFSAAGGLATLVIFAMYTVYQGAGVGNSIWLARWTDDKFLMNASNVNTTQFKTKNFKYLEVYGAIGLSQAVIILLYSLLASSRMVRAAGVLHHGMLLNVLKLPMAFFDTTPIGRVLNRFSRDVETIDNILPWNFKRIIYMFFNTMSILVVIIYTTPLFTVILLPMGILYYMIQRFSIPTSRQLMRVQSKTRSPIYSHFGETIAGASTIRGYRVQQRFIAESRNKVDKNMVFWFAWMSTIRWLAFRLEILGYIVVFSAAIFAVTTPGNTGGLVGLSISYALQVTSALKFMVRSTIDVETNAVSIERVKEYSEKTKEAEWTLPKKRPAKDWPEVGNVEFNGYCTRYRAGLELVLKGISCQIYGGEKIGIVGRTGAGKSSLTLALFRIIESVGGSIVIDGERIADMGLHDLRSKLTILPQDPVLFSGTLRMNLDPFDEYKDEHIWRALEHAHLKNFISGVTEGLEYECGEGGHNLSVGQRQLVCLARTLLHKTKVLIFDEATAAVDMETDDLIQKTIREEFRGCTILTIAHRLNTVMDYDRIMVMDQGQIREFDSPQKLLGDSSSIFYGMAKSVNLV